MLGSVRVVGSESFAAEVSLISLKFIHGVLYCSSLSSVHAIFLGNVEADNTICELDVFTIASEAVPFYGIDNTDVSYPAPIITALAQPYVLAHHAGGLLVSTLFGLRLLPLSHPILRIGTLLAANLLERARKWIIAVPNSEHDNVAHFLIRRGHADLVFSDLNGLSLATHIDLCMKFERVDELHHLIDSHGSEIVDSICDCGNDGGYSDFLAIGLFMIGKRRIECVQKLIAEATETGVRELQMDAMKLSSFISVVDQPSGVAALQKVTEAMNAANESGIALVNVV